MFRSRSARVSAVRSGWCIAILAATALLSAAPARADAAGMKITQNAETITIQQADQPILEYRFSGVPYKPYVQKLFSLEGVNLLRDAPHDHLHHHGLMFALAVDGTCVWTEAARDKPGRQTHRAVESIATFDAQGAAGARFSERLDWIGPDERTLLHELRTIEVTTDPSRSVRLLTWRTRLETPPERASVTLGGAHYYGLGIRLVESMDRVGRLATAEGKTGQRVRGDERVVPAAWMAYTAPCEGKPRTVALFDHPANPRYPAGIFSMTQPFAYLSATLNLCKEPLALEAGRPLALCYGVAVWDGDVTPAEVERAWQQWSTRATSAAPR